MCLRSEPGDSVVVSCWTNESKGIELGSVRLRNSDQLGSVCLPVGGSASPFIDEGGGFRGERERCRIP